MQPVIHRSGKRAHDSRLTKAKLAASLLLGMACCHPELAHAETVTHTLALSHVVQDDGRSPESLRMTLLGAFDIPAFPAGTIVQSASLAFSIEAGGAIWRTGRPDEEMRGAVSFSAAVTRDGGSWPFFTSGTPDTSWTGAIGRAHVADLNQYPLPNNIPLPSLQDYVVGSDREVGGYVPIPVRMDLDASGNLAFVPPPYYPSRFLFAAGIELQATFNYVLPPAVAQAAAAGESPAAEPVVYAASTFVSGAELMPAEIRAQLPEYLSISSVPEVPAAGMFAAGMALLFALRARRGAGGQAAARR